MVHWVLLSALCSLLPKCFLGSFSLAPIVELYTAVLSLGHAALNGVKGKKDPLFLLQALGRERLRFRSGKDPQQLLLYGNRAETLARRLAGRRIHHKSPGRVQALKAKGIRPGLATVLVGDDPASH